MKRKSLFQLALDNSETKVKVHTRKAVILQKESPVKRRFKNLKAFPQRKGVGKVGSSVEVLNMLTPVTKKAALDSDISNLYIPKEKRLFKNPAAIEKRKKEEEELKRRAAEEEKKVKFDLA